ncbi:MAG: TrmH family RNA methyltransferase [Spirochaetota bacterium]
MANLENFEKLSKKNQAKKIFFLIDNILLKLKIEQKENIENKNTNSVKDELQKLIEYLKIYKKLGDLNTEIIKQIQNNDILNLSHSLLELRNIIITKIGISEAESDYINYTKFGGQYNKEKREDNSNLVVILDNIRSPFNAGSIIRSAEAFGFDKVILYGISAKLPLEKIYRTSMNAEKLIELVFINNKDNLLDIIDNEKYKLVLIEKNKDSKILWETKLNGKLALVLGNEEFGISDELYERAELTLEIPQFGIKNSINVASAFSIVASYFAYYKEKEKYL